MKFKTKLKMDIGAVYIMYPFKLSTEEEFTNYTVNETTDKFIPIK